MNWLDSTSVSMMNKSLDGLWAKQRAHNDNIANAETPGYKRKYVSFESELARVLDQGAKSGAKKSELIRDIKNTKVFTGVADNETTRADDNGVNSEYENIELARAQLQYRAITQSLTSHFTRLSAAISGTSR